MMYADMDNATILEHTIEHQISICRPLFHWGLSTSLVGLNSRMVVSKWGCCSPRRTKRFRCQIRPYRLIKNHICKSRENTSEHRQLLANINKPFGSYCGNLENHFHRNSRFVEFFEIHTYACASICENWNWKRWELVIFRSRFSAAFCLLALFLALGPGHCMAKTMPWRTRQKNPDCLSRVVSVTLAMFQEFTWNPIQLEATDLIVEGETEQKPATRSMLELIFWQKNHCWRVSPF